MGADLPLINRGYMDNTRFLICADLAGAGEEQIKAWQRDCDHWSNLGELPPHVTIIPPWWGSLDLETIRPLLNAKVEGQATGWRHLPRREDNIIVLDLESASFASIEDQVRNAVPIPPRRRPAEYHLTIAKWIPHAEFPELWRKVQDLGLPPERMSFALHLYRFDETAKTWLRVE